MGAIIGKLCSADGFFKSTNIKDNPATLLVQGMTKPNSPLSRATVSRSLKRTQSTLTIDIDNLFKNSELPGEDSPRSSLITSIASDHKITENDFEFRDLLGTGGYSRVYLAHQKGNMENGLIFAIKTISKIQFKKEEWNQFLTELKILAVVSCTPCQFLTHLYCSFQSDFNLYFCLEYVPGGSLRKYLDLKHTFDLNCTTFVAAEILIGILYLHKKLQIFHRDLKPENVLIDEEGHCKLTDFGLSAIGKIEAYSFCGTFNYLAPEMINKKGYSNLVDFWMLGCIIYEMLVGKPPFSYKNKKTMLDMINSGCYRSNLIADPVARDIVSKLLVVEPKYRLGAKGSNEILKHAFFKGTSFKMLIRKQIESPLKPFVTITKVDETLVNDPNLIQEELEMQIASKRPKLERFSWIKCRKVPSKMDDDDFLEQ